MPFFLSYRAKIKKYKRNYSGENNNKYGRYDLYSTFLLTQRRMT